MFEREGARVKALEKAEKEVKAKAQREAAMAAEPVTRVTNEDLEKVRVEPVRLADGVCCENHGSVGIC